MANRQKSGGDERRCLHGDQVDCSNATYCSIQSTDPVDKFDDGRQMKAAHPGKALLIYTHPLACHVGYSASIGPVQFLNCLFSLHVLLLLMPLICVLGV
jgi:hypothetical protein